MENKGNDKSRSDKKFTRGVIIMGLKIYFFSNNILSLKAPRRESSTSRHAFSLFKKHKTCLTNSQQGTSFHFSEADFGERKNSLFLFSAFQICPEFPITKRCLIKTFVVSRLKQVKFESLDFSNPDLNSLCSFFKAIK